MIRVVEHTVTMYIFDQKRNNQTKLKYRLILVLIEVLILLLVWKGYVVLFRKNSLSVMKNSDE